MIDFLLLPWALILGLLGAGSIHLLKMWKNNEWVKPTPKTIASLALGPLAAFLMWLMGDGAQVIGVVAYFAIGATSEEFLTEIIEKYTKKKTDK